MGVRCSVDANGATIDSSLIVTRTGGVFAIQTHKPDGYNFNELTTQLSGWTPVTLVANFGESTYSFDVGGTTGGGPIATKCEPRYLDMFVGIAYANGVTSSWEVRYDNVETIQP
jgi:hypothetical protein